MNCLPRIRPADGDRPPALNQPNLIKFNRTLLSVAWAPEVYLATDYPVFLSIILCVAQHPLVLGYFITAQSNEGFSRYNHHTAMQYIYDAPLFYETEAIPSSMMSNAMVSSSDVIVSGGQSVKTDPPPTL